MKSAEVYKQWTESKEYRCLPLGVVDKPQHFLVYDDGSHINLVSEKNSPYTHEVVIGNSESSFIGLQAAERFLWENHAKYNKTNHDYTIRGYGTMHYSNVLGGHSIQRVEFENVFTEEEFEEMNSYGGPWETITILKEEDFPSDFEDLDDWVPRTITIIKNA